MTLTLTYLTRDYIVQAADRLLTRGGTEFDPSANKIVLLSARDGIASIVYSGTAYMGDQPTDNWIADTLRSAIDAEFDFPRRSGVRLGLTVNSAMISLRDAMSATCPEIARETKHFELSIFVAGWQTSGRRICPVVFKLRSSARNKPPWVALFAAKPRDWCSDAPRSVHSLPTFPQHRASINELCARLTPTLSRAQAASHISQTIADISTANPLVGPNVQYVVLPRKTDEAVEVHYAPASDTPSFTDGVSQHPASYTPWIIGSSGSFSPSVVAGSDAGLGLDTRWFSFHAPSPVEERSGGWELTSAYASMKRPNRDGVREKPREPSSLPLAAEPRAGHQWVNGRYEPIPAKDDDTSTRANV